jgi:3-methyladenine DNA glycosylase Mpg
LLPHGGAFATLEEARLEVAHYLDTYFNLDRRHSALDYRTGPRVGVAAAAEHPWRFWLPDEASVSAYRPGGRKRIAGTRQTEAP